jgi:hypothetical protein
VPWHGNRRLSDGPCTCRPRARIAVALKLIWYGVCCSPPDLLPNVRYACLRIWEQAIPLG